MLDTLLIEILVDPEDKLPLWYFEDDDVLYNPRLHRRYDVRDGIPVLLIDEAVVIDAEQAAKFEAKAKVSVIETGTSSSS